MTDAEREELVAWLQERENQRVPLTDSERSEIADALYAARMIEKFPTHWEYAMNGSSGTGPSLSGVLDMLVGAD